MEIIVKTATLAKALSETTSFVPAKTSISILRFSKVVTKGNRIKIEANDMMCSIRSYIEAESISEDGSFLIDPILMSKYISKIKDDTIMLTVSDTEMILKHGKGKTLFSIMPVKDYPDFDMPTDNMTEVVLPSDVFSEFTASARKFVGNDELRPQMRPIYAYIKNGCFGVTATDTRAMFNDSFEISGLGDTCINWYIEPALFGPLSVANTKSDLITVKITPTHVSYRVGNTVYQSTQTKGKYPDFERVIPKQWTIECDIDRKDMIESINRVSILAEDSRLVKLDISNIEMSISIDNITKLNKSTEMISHNGCNGVVIIGFHAEYLLTCLGVCHSDEVQLRITDQSRPMIFHQADKPNRVCLLMPMVINP